ncbi:MAG TPA: nuclear transport factor 2 family protein [Lysobacter sp.]|nr:nuclear transport factor 2 family protein [Lysobacter sp.]
MNSSIAAVLLAFATAAIPAPRDEDALRALEHAWNTAIVERDPAALERILDDEFRLVWIDGSVSDKAAMLRGLATRKVEIEPFVTENVEIRIYGDAAVVTGQFSQTVRLGERSETNRFAYTDVYRRTAAGWRAVSAHATLLRAPTPPPAATAAPPAAGPGGR